VPIAIPRCSKEFEVEVKVVAAQVAAEEVASCRGAAAATICNLFVALNQ